MTEEFENFGNDDFSAVEFSENPDPRCPMVVVLDCSDSMVEVRPGEDRSPLDALNGSLDILVTELNKDPLAKRRAEVSFVAYGTDVAPATDFKTVDQLILPNLSRMGVTSTGSALVEALDALEERKNEYKANGIEYLRPIMMLITDGLQTDDTSEAKRRLAEAHEKKKASFFAVGVEGADMDALAELSPRSPIKLKGVKFEEMFQWLSASAASASASQPDQDKIAIEKPGDDWAEL